MLSVLLTTQPHVHSAHTHTHIKECCQVGVYFVTFIFIVSIITEQVLDREPWRLRGRDEEFLILLVLTEWQSRPLSDTRTICHKKEKSVSSDSNNIHAVTGDIYQWQQWKLDVRTSHHNCFHRGKQHSTNTKRSKARGTF